MKLNCNVIKLHWLCQITRNIDQKVSKNSYIVYLRVCFIVLTSRRTKKFLNLQWRNNMLTIFEHNTFSIFELIFYVIAEILKSYMIRAVSFYLVLKTILLCDIKHQDMQEHLIKLCWKEMIHSWVYLAHPRDHCYWKHSIFAEQSYRAFFSKSEAVQEDLRKTLRLPCKSEKGYSISKHDLFFFCRSTAHILWDYNRYVQSTLNLFPKVERSLHPLKFDGSTKKDYMINLVIFSISYYSSCFHKLYPYHEDFSWNETFVVGYD